MVTHDPAVGQPRFRSDDPDHLDRWYAEHLGVTSAWSVRFEVTDLDATVARLRAEGIAIEVDPRQYADGSYAELRDPEGNPIQLWQPAAGSTHDGGVYVYPIDDEDDPADPEQRTSKRHRLPMWLPALLAAVVAGAFVLVSDPTGDDSSGSSAATASETTAPRSTTTTATTSTSNDPGAVQVTELGHPLLGVTGGWELFVHASGELVRIELDSGTITRTTLPSPTGSGPASLVVGPPGALVGGIGADSAYLVVDGEAPQRVTFGSRSSMRILPGPEPGQVWVASFGPGRKPVRAMSFDGHATGRRLSMPLHSSGLPGGDARGNLLVTGPGGTYVAGAGELRRVTTGTVLAAGATRLLVLECDGRASCSTIVVERSSGDRHVLNSGVEFRFGRNGVVAADGSFAAVGTGRRPTRGIRLINLDNGQAYTPDVRIEPAFRGGAMAWAPNGRWLFVVTPGGNLSAVNSATHQVSKLDLALPSVKNIAVRPG